MNDEDAHDRPTIKAMSPFALYLRTGLRIVPSATNGDIELKFNPWHDPEDGRFTFVGQGRYYGRGADRFRGGGGGSFSGGGATARDVWPDPKIKPPKKPKIVSKPSEKSTTARLQGNIKRSPVPNGNVRQSQPNLIARAQESRLLPDTAEPIRTAEQYRVTKTEQKNGYRFQIDGIGRTRRASGVLSLGDAERRSKRNQLEAGVPDRLPGDDGGHFIGLRFNGPRDKFNHFAQESGFNRGSYRKLEDGWAKDVAAGRQVVVDIVPQFRGLSQRPYHLDVRWSVDGRWSSRSVPNQKKEK